MFLFTIVSLPYMTRVLGHSGDLQAGTVLYAADVALVGLTMIAMSCTCGEPGPDASRSAAGAGRPQRSRRRDSTAAFALSIPIAFVDTTLAEYSWLVMAVGGNLVSTVIRRFARGTFSIVRAHGDVLSMNRRCNSVVSV